MQNFNLAAGEWGAPYGLISPPGDVSGVGVIIWKRPDNTLLVAYSNRDSFVSGAASGLGYAVYDLTANSWGSVADLGANATALTGWDSTQTIFNMSAGGSPASIMDSTGRCHFFFFATSTETTPVIWGNRCFYQAVEADGSLGSFYDFPGQVAPLFTWNSSVPMQDLTAYSGSPMGTPVIIGDAIALPVLNVNTSPNYPVGDQWPQQLPNLYIGTPLSAPVWTKDSTKTIDPGAIADDSIWAQEAPVMACDGTTLVAVYTAQNSSANFARLRVCQTTNLTDPTLGWTASTVYDIGVNTPPGSFPATPSLRVLSVALLAPPPPPPPPPIPAMPRTPCWMMDVSDQYGKPLVSSVPLITGVWPAANVLAPWDYLRIGSAFIINQTGGASDIPDDTNLGSAYQMLWDSNSGYASNPLIVPLTNSPNQQLTVALPINGGSVTLNLRIYYNQAT